MVQERESERLSRKDCSIEKEQGGCIVDTHFVELGLVDFLFSAVRQVLVQLDEPEI